MLNSCGLTGGEEEKGEADEAGREEGREGGSGARLKIHRRPRQAARHRDCHDSNNLFIIIIIIYCYSYHVTDLLFLQEGSGKRRAVLRT